LWKNLVWKTYPENPDAWCENSLTPPEGVWTFTRPERQKIELTSDSVIVGSRSVRTSVEECADWWFCEPVFLLHDGKEFNALTESPRLRFYIKANQGSDGWGAGHDQHVELYDIAGKKAYREIATKVGVFEYFDLPLGPGAGWTEDAGFNWRFVKAIAFPRWGYLYKYLWIDSLHFAYYEVVAAKLTILSQPSGKNFKIDTVFLTTPQTLSVTPNVDYEVSMEPTNFDHWENGDTKPVRTFRLAEGQEYTATAYYKEGPPPVSWVLPVFLGLCGIFIVGSIIIYRKVK
jgi:hypothetical protein